MRGRVCMRTSGGDPLDLIDPSGLWPLGAPTSGFDFGGVHVPSKKIVIGQLQEALYKSGFCRNSDQSRQIAVDIVDKVGWNNLGLAKSIMDSIQSGKPLSQSRISSALNFINQLPSPDRPPLTQLMHSGGK